MDKKELDEILDKATKEKYLDEFVSNKNKNLMFIDDNNSVNLLNTASNKIIEEKNKIETIQLKDTNNNANNHFSNEDEVDVKDNKINFKHDNEINNTSKDKHENINTATKKLKNKRQGNKRKKTYKKNNSNKKLFIYIILFIITLLILLFGILNYNEKEITCTYEVKTNDFVVNDTYQIYYQNNKINFVEGTYKYESKSKDFNEQTKYIKEEKLPVVLNSYAMKGFTYVYELNDSTFKINSYLEYDKFDMNNIKKINQDKFPISYYKIDSNKPRKLKKQLENKGFICKRK